MPDDSTLEKVKQYLQEHPTGRIIAAELSRQLGTTRQNIHSILNRLGETRHHPSKVKNTCSSCGKEIGRYAQFCRTHSKAIERSVGNYYKCRVCSQYKLLEHFAKNIDSYSGYETRCLTCRAEWQRDYYRLKGRKQHLETTRALSKKHPERRKAYYQVQKALRLGTLTKSPCYSCNSPDSQAIHLDYSQPLNVMWSCLSCRKNLINKMGLT